MRREPFRIPWSATLVLLIVNVVAFIGQLVARHLLPFSIEDYLRAEC